MKSTYNSNQYFQSQKLRPVQFSEMESNVDTDLKVLKTVKIAEGNPLSISETLQVDLCTILRVFVLLKAEKS